MAHIALYRKYRSQTFGDLVGQEHVIKTLQSAIARGKIAHSYLFTGPRGTGKTSTARLLAKALNCEKGPAAEPCNECQACQEITIGNSLDVIEMDAASESGVENVRVSIVEAADYQPASSRYRVFIIDEVHDLSRQAFDALLKTIEEPPAHVVFILATTELPKVPPTIRSRCQRFEFHRGSLQELVSRLKHVVSMEGVEVEPAALTAIARMSDGGFRDALTLLEQAILTTEGTITLQLVFDQLGLVASETVDTILGQMSAVDVPGLMCSLEGVYQLGRDPRALLESILHRLADLTRAAYGVDTDGFDDAAQEAALKSSAASLGVDKILTYRAAMAEAHSLIRDVSIPRVWLEAELIRISLDKVVAPAKEAARPAPTLTQAKGVTPVVPDPPVTSAVVTPTPVPKQVRPTSGDPEIDRMQVVWDAVYEALAPSAPVVANRLQKVSVGKVQNGVATVEFERTMDFEYVMDRPKAQAAIRQQWDALGGAGVVVEFVLAKKASNGPAPKEEATAVELPAEGERLVEIVHEVFGSGGRSGE